LLTTDGVFLDMSLRKSVCTPDVELTTSEKLLPSYKNNTLNTITDGDI